MALANVAVNSYENAKGKSAKTDYGHPSAPATSETKPLTEDELALCIYHRDFINAYMPDAREFIKDLVDCGLITGWRDVISTELKDIDGFPTEDR